MNVRHVLFRWDGRLARYKPVRRGRGSFTAPVDEATGQIVEPTGDVPGFVDAGWRVAKDAPAHDPVEVMEFLGKQRLSERRRVRW